MVETRYDWVRSRLFGKILDIGCNAGQLLAGHPLAANAHGVDIDDWRPPYGLGFTRSDAAHLPFKDGEYHCAVLGEILEHVPDPVAVIKEARRCVGGCVFISVPFEQVWDKRNKPMMPLEERLRLDGVSYEEKFRQETIAHPECKDAVDDRKTPHLWHIRYYTLDMLCDDIEKAGLKYKIELLSYDGWVFFMGALK